MDVGFIGLGRMGLPMAGHIQKQGASGRLTLLDRFPERLSELVAGGAEVAGDAREVARNSDLVILMVPAIGDIDALLEGPDGLIAGVSEPTVLVVSSTVAPQDVRDLATRLGAASNGLLQVVDAPVSGGEAGATAGTLSIMVGGDEEPATRAIEVLEACGSPVLCGPLGAGEVVKACNQMVVGITMAALSEAALIAEGAGVDTKLMYTMLANGWGGSAVLNAKREKVEQRDYTNSGAAKFMVKDLKIALGEASATGRTLPLSSQALEIYQGLTEAGLGDDDLAVVHKYLGETTQQG